jgi:hypothetical protein
VVGGADLEHAFVTDRQASAIELDADHRRHAVCELAIRDLNDGAGLRHCPSGVFLANAAWLVIATLAHNLLRWVATIGLGSSDLLVTKTLRRRLLHLPGRLTRSARRRRLHLPTDWPWPPSSLPLWRAWRRCRCAPDGQGDHPKRHRGRHGLGPACPGVLVDAPAGCWELAGVRSSPSTPTGSPVGTTQQTPDLGVNQAPRWIQADIPQFMRAPLPASVLSVTESGQQKGAGR